MTELSQLMDTIDELKSKLSDSEYLEIMNLLKKIHKCVLAEHTMDLLDVYNCPSEGVHCECHVDKKVNMMLTDLNNMMMLKQLIVKMAADMYDVNY